MNDSDSLVLDTAREKKSVLIIDDDLTNIVALRQILSDDYTVYAEKDGREAIKVAKVVIPDIILLDIIMPKMDGYEVLKELKGSEDTKMIPVIIITSLTNAADEEKGISLGAYDYIQKPFKGNLVKFRIRNQLKLSDRVEQLTQKKLEKERIEVLNHAKLEFLLRMSHEMLTPMNSIIGLTQVAKLYGTPDSNFYLEKIDESAQLLLGIIHDLLDVSSLGEGTLRLKSKPFSLTLAIAAAEEAIKPYFDEKSQEFVLDLDKDIPDFIIGDKKRVTQVIKNILMNANKFTHGSGTIKLTTFIKEIKGDEFTIGIEIFDNGIGIPKDKQEKIFNYFEQSDDGLSRQFGGVGLGLSISKHIVEMMGGKIWVESTVDQGTKFTFTFIAKKSEPKAAKYDTSALAQMRTDFRGKSVLLVEDTLIYRSIIIDKLHEYKIDVDCAESGIEALKLIQETPDKYDLIFMDIIMPVMDGLETTRRIREMDGMARIPIVALSTRNKQKDIYSGLEAGMNDYITKPIDFDELFLKLNKYLKDG